MNDRDYNYLLKKYKVKQPGEMFVSEEMKREFNNTGWRLNQKLFRCEIIMDRLNIKGTSREMCLNIVKKIPLKQLHGKASCETIITAICFYVKKVENSSSKLEDYSVCRENNLDHKKFNTILCNLCNYYQKNSYIK